MISAGDFRNGITLEIDGTVFQIIEFQHVKPGKGAAFVRTKYKNILTGAIREDAFNPSDKFRWLKWSPDSKKILCRRVAGLMYGILITAIVFSHTHLRPYYRCRLTKKQKIRLYYTYRRTCKDTCTQKNC